jgi:hypothetical protein
MLLMQEKHLVENTSMLKFSCNCPDASKKKNQFYDGVPQIVSDWSSSDSGAQNGECKHVWAVKIIMGLVKEGDVPSDILVRPLVSDDEKIKEVYQKDDSKGHAFNWQDSFGFDEFEFYEGG